MNAEWDIRDPSRKCTRCERPFAEGEPVFSALRETEDGFERLDCCAACWGAVEAEGFYSRWRTVACVREEPLARRMSGKVVLDFFHHLEGETERRKQCFRYVLGLMLVRKKVMRFLGVERGSDGDFLVLKESGSAVEYRVADPRLTPDEVASLTEEVGRLLQVSVAGQEGPDADVLASAPAQEEPPRGRENE